MLLLSVIGLIVPALLHRVAAADVRLRLDTEIAVVLFVTYAVGPGVHVPHPPRRVRRRQTRASSAASPRSRAVRRTRVGPARSSCSRQHRGSRGGQRSPGGLGDRDRRTARAHPGLRRRHRRCAGRQCSRAFSAVTMAARARWTRRSRSRSDRRRRSPCSSRHPGLPELPHRARADGPAVHAVRDRGPGRRGPEHLVHRPRGETHWMEGVQLLAIYRSSRSGSSTCPRLQAGQAIGYLRRPMASRRRA